MNNEQSQKEKNQNRTLLEETNLNLCRLHEAIQELIMLNEKDTLKIDAFYKEIIQTFTGSESFTAAPTHPAT
jgi:hypothetical protein